jgi:putative membrane protein
MIAGAWAQGAGPDDPQIAAIMVTANQVDIDAGKLAKSQAHSTEVKDFAQGMITDHSGVNKSATELVQKLHVTPETNATSQSLQIGGQQSFAALKKLRGNEFWFASEVERSPPSSRGSSAGGIARRASIRRCRHEDCV